MTADMIRNLRTFGRHQQMTPQTIQVVVADDGIVCCTVHMLQVPHATECCVENIAQCKRVNEKLELINRSGLINEVSAKLSYEFVEEQLNWFISPK